MGIHLHLVGGAGRIGSALTKSLMSNRMEGIEKLWIYCDSTKAKEINKLAIETEVLGVRARGYSGFSITKQIEQGAAKHDDSHVIVILRGINDKVSWLNQPLKALELHAQICRQITESDLWMHRNIKLIHMSSQLCDLIEGPTSLVEICEGQESYRRPYMVSRLHQEAILTAHAFEHGVPTCIVRLPAVYGFEDDDRSPWVLNSLCSQYSKNGVMTPRNGEKEIYLTQKDFLIYYLRDLIGNAFKRDQNLTVSFRRPPMLRMRVETLAQIILGEVNGATGLECTDLGVRMLSDTSEYAIKGEHVKVLRDTIKRLMKDV